MRMSLTSTWGASSSLARLSAASRSRGQLLTGGVELRNEMLYNDKLTGGHDVVQHRSLYLQDEIEFDKSLALTLGLRHDRNELFGSESSPRAYAVWHATPQWTIKAGMGHGFKAPTLKQITAGYQEDEGPNTYFANPSLRPETNDSVELGAGWETPAASVQAMLFANRVKNLIITKLLSSAAGRGTYVFENTDRARLQGLETTATVMIGGGFKSVLNYQYLDATDGLGARLEKRPRHTLGARIDWEGGAWRAGLRADHTHDQLLASLVAGQALQPVPAVTLVGAQGSWQLGPQVALGAGVDNLSDVRLSAKSPLFIYAEAPRTWRLSLRYRW